MANGTSRQNGADTRGLMRTRKIIEALAWVALIAFLWTVDTFAKITYRNNAGFGKDNLHLITEQVTSAVAVLVMLIFASYWLRLFPLRRGQWATAVIGHTAGSIIFAFGHHVLMILQRAIFYAAMDVNYIWQPNFVANLIVEYQKDIKIYAGIVAVMSAYQYYRRTQSTPLSHPEVGNRLVVQTGSGEAFLNYEEIDYIEASRNYVEVHAGSKAYLIRDTFANTEKRLRGGPFTRSHRSYIVNLDKVAEIKTIDGAQQIHLKGGAALPLSRGYREAFKAAIAGSP